MKNIVFTSLLSLTILFGVSACKSPTKAAVKHKTGVGKGPVEKTTDKAEKKVDHNKKDLEKKLP